MIFLDNGFYLLRVWRANVRASIIREMEFRFNFLSGLFRQTLWATSFILLVDIIFKNTDSLAGWTQGETLLLLALSRIIEGLSDTLFNRNISELPNVINDGKFDFYLTKPIPAQFHTAFHRLKILDLGNVVIGFIIFGYALRIDQNEHSLITWLILIFLSLMGMIIYYSILISLASISFFLEKMNSFQAIDNLISEPLTYPFDIFPSGIRTLLTYLIPLVFIVHIPAQSLTDRFNLLHIPLSFGTAATFLLIANIIWRAGIRRYSSASS